ncbi:hypothetical protein Tco_0330996 [Tanacetum coccineum]
MLEQVESVAYKLKLPQELSRVYNMFHVSNLKKYYCDESLAVPLGGLHLNNELWFVKKPVEVMNREVKRLRQSHNLIVKVRWNSRRGPELHVNCFNMMLTHGAKPPKTATQRIRSRAETANTRRRKQNTLNTEKRERQRRRREKKRKKKEEKKESFKTQEEGEVQKKTQPERRHRKRGEEEKNEQELNGALQRRVTKQEKLERAKPEKEKAARNRGEKRGRKDGAHNGTKREQSRQREEK